MSPRRTAPVDPGAAGVAERRAVAVLTALALLTTLGGCTVSRSPSQSSPTPTAGEPTPAEVKAAVQRRERQIAELVPAELVDRIRSLERGSFLGCVDGRASWSGRTWVYLHDADRVRSAVEAIGRALDDAGEGTVTSRVDASGDRAYTLTLPGNEQYLIGPGPTSDPTVIWIDSFSRCVALPAGVLRGDSY